MYDAAAAEDDDDIIIYICVRFQVVWLKDPKEKENRAPELL